MERKTKTKLIPGHGAVSRETWKVPNTINPKVRFESIENFKKIKKICYQKGAMDVISDVHDILDRMIAKNKGEIILRDVMRELRDVYRKYDLNNLLIGNELDRAQEMSE